MRAPASLFTLLVLLGFSTASGQGNPSSDHRLPAPSISDQVPIVEAIRTQYERIPVECSGTNPPELIAQRQLAVSRQLRQMAADAETDHVRPYVLLQEAISMAVRAGDFDAAFGATDDLAKLYSVDANGMKLGALLNAINRPNNMRPQVLNNYLNVAEAAVSRGDIQMALIASQLAEKIARHVSIPMLTERTQQVERRVSKARRELAAVGAAAKKLHSAPDDPDANLVVGQYLCFVRSRWDDGLPFLANGTDLRLRVLARMDLRRPTDYTAMVDLADTWWNLPDSEHTPRQRSHERAAYWYAQALAGLKGASWARACDRITEVKRASVHN